MSAIEEVRHYFATLKGRPTFAMDAMAVGLMVRGFTCDQVRDAMATTPRERIDSLGDPYLAAVDAFADVLGLPMYPEDE